MENPAVPNQGTPTNGAHDQGTQGQGVQAQGGQGQAVQSQGNFLQSRRLRISLGIAVVEGLLVVANVIPEWAVFVVAIGAGVYWWMSGRHASSPMVRQGSWILAASQVFLVLVPLFFIFFKTVAYVVLAVLAIVALVFLFTEREHKA